MEPSSIKALNTGISSHNPFVGAATVREPDVWHDRPADSPGLNGESRSTLHAAYARICQGETVSAVTIQGRTGTGKTHELNCLRHHIHTAKTPGLFVYLNVQQFAESHAVRQQLLRSVCDSLTRRMPSGLLQWQQLALAFANHALRSLDNSRKHFVPHSVLDLLSRNSLEQNQNWIDRISEAFFRVRPDIDDPELIRAIFWTLCSHQLPYARKWLSGQTLPRWKRDELGLAPVSHHNPESQAWQGLLNLLAAIEHYAPIAIVFDHFEYPELPEPTVQKERVAVGTIKWLSERLRTRSRRYGVMFACAMHPRTWHLVEDHFGPIARWAHDRGQPSTLSDVNTETVEMTVSCWLQAFYEKRQLVPPTSLYPFESAQISALVRESVDLHDAINWCAENFQPVEADPLEPIELRFNQIVRELGEAGLGDDRRIGAAIGQAFRYLQGCELTVDGEVSERMEVCSEDSGSPGEPVPVCIASVAMLPHTAKAFSIAIDIKVRGTVRQVGVRVVSSTNGRQLCAQLDRCYGALARETESEAPGEVDRPNKPFDLGCILRPVGAAIPPHWKAAQRYEEFTHHAHGTTLDFTLDEIAPLLAIAQLEDEIQAATVTPRAAVPNENDMQSFHIDPEPAAADIRPECDELEETSGFGTAGSTLENDATLDAQHNLELGATSSGDCAACNPTSDLDEDRAIPVEQPADERHFSRIDAPLGLSLAPFDDRDAQRLRLSRSTPPSETHLTSQMLADWVDRENIAIDNAIVASVVAAAIDEFEGNSPTISAIAPSPQD